MHALRILAFGLVLAAGFAACKKEETPEATKNYLSGDLQISCETFILQNGRVAFKAYGVKHPDFPGKTGHLTFTWKIPKLMSSTAASEDTQKDTAYWSYTFPDTLKTYTVYCYAHTDEGEYYDKTATHSVIIVKPGIRGSLQTVLNDHVGLDEMTDARDGQVYPTQNIGNLVWMRTNLAWAGDDGKTGVPYFRAGAMSRVFGRYYDYPEVASGSLCPSGWRIPSEQDWINSFQSLSATALEARKDWVGIAGALLDYGTFNGDPITEYWPTVNITNQSGFSAHCLGYATGDATTQYFTGYASQAVFWTSDTSTDPIISATGTRVSPTYAYYRYMVYDRPDLYSGRADTQERSFLCSLRCVKDL